MTEPTNDEGDAIRNRRVALMLTQREVADLAGISDETLRKLEQGVSVSMRSRRRVLEVLDDLEAPHADDGPLAAPTIDLEERARLLAHIAGSSAFGGLDRLTTDALRQLAATLDLAQMVVRDADPKASTTNGR